MTVSIRSNTTSSPEESLASNLQWETEELTATRATSTDVSLFKKRPQEKKECRAERAADVMGPVDRGERMMERKGAIISVRDMDETSKGQTKILPRPCVSETLHTPCALLRDLFNSSKPDIRSSSLLPCCGVGTVFDPGRRSPRLLARAESLV
jgi:hypothetical protein